MREIRAERGLVEVYTNPRLMEGLARLREARIYLDGFSITPSAAVLYREEHKLSDNTGPFFDRLIKDGLGLHLNELPGLIEQRGVALSNVAEENRTLVEQNALLASQSILAQRLGQEKDPTQKIGITEMLARIDSSVKVHSV